MRRIKQQELAEMLAAYMRAKKMVVADDPGTSNIAYLEGSEYSGIINQDTFDHWNDRRIVFGMVKGQWQILHNVLATTEPGRYYTEKPLHDQGAARIAFGQYEAWRPGKHNDIQPALVQVRPVTVHRDMNKNGIRDKSDRLDTGLFGINQHSTARNFKGKSIGLYSAGCLVGWDYNEHGKFLSLVCKDARFLESPKSYIFRTAIIAGDKFYHHFF